MLIITEPGSGKTNALLNWISHQSDIDKLCLHTKSLCGEKYKLPIIKSESVELKHCNYLKVFIEY